MSLNELEQKLHSYTYILRIQKLGTKSHDLTKHSRKALRVEKCQPYFKKIHISLIIWVWYMNLQEKWE